MDSKFDTKAARAIVCQLYVAKGLKRNPAKMIKFIRENREYFNIPDYQLESIKKENNVTEEDIEKEESVKFADIHAEEKFDKAVLEKAEKIHEIRKQEEDKRDHGHGIKSINEDDMPKNIYNGRES
jgi:hypothetical protein